MEKGNKKTKQGTIIVPNDKYYSLLNKSSHTFENFADNRSLTVEKVIEIDVSVSVEPLSVQ